MASYILSLVFNSPPHLSITITSRDIKGNKNNINNTIIVFKLREEVLGVTGFANIQYIGFNSNA
jgi:hypothetical protein